LEFGVGFLLRGADEIGCGEETEGDAVLGGGGFAGFCAGAGAGLSVGYVGCDLGWSWLSKGTVMK
jgi:hypothetical protein